MPGERKEAGGPAQPPEGKAAKLPRPCPICGKPAEQAFLPFCSPRCRDVDLNRWLTGRYVVPGPENNEDDGE